MTKLEQKLFDVLIPFGEPTNILIYDNVLTFNLLTPKHGTEPEGVKEIQKTVIDAFPEYFIARKLVNNKLYYWAVLIKDEKR